MKVEFVRPSEKINALLAEKELEAEKLPEVDSEELVPLHFSED